MSNIGLKGFGRINQSLVNRMVVCDADRCNETVKGKGTFTYKSSHVYEARITIPSPSRGILMIQICIDLFLHNFSFLFFLSFSLANRFFPLFVVSIRLDAFFSTNLRARNYSNSLGQEGGQVAY